MIADAIGDPVDVLLRQHAALDDLFARHQAALLDRRWAEAARILEEYGVRLRSHIELEERHLLPRFARIATVRWPAGIYRAEHRRSEQLLEKAWERLAHERRRGITTASLISLIDEERTLKHLIEHHHEREEKGLFGELRAELPAEARSALGAALIAAEPH